MAEPRYTVTRGQLGSPVLHDNVERRPVLVAMRNTDHDPKVADAAAVQMLSTCQQALNRVDAEAAWARQQEGGK